jgi:hypothetical protein
MNKFTQYKQLIILLLFFQYSAVGQEWTMPNIAPFLNIPFGKTETEVRSIIQSKNYIITERSKDKLYISNVSWGGKTPFNTYLRFNTSGVFIEGAIVITELKDMLDIERLITAKYGQLTKDEGFIGTNKIWYKDTFSIVFTCYNGVCQIKYQDNKLCDIEAQDILNEKLKNI